MAIVYLGLGANMGDRKQSITSAINALQQNGFDISGVAPLYVSRAAGFEGGEFYNTVVCAETEHDTYDLMSTIQTIESSLGKIHKQRARNEEIVYEDRPIDIDVLLYDDMISSTSDLTVPHRSIGQRDFVLVPLLHLASDLRDPMSDEPFSEVLEKLTEEEKTILDVIHDWYS